MNTFDLSSVALLIVLVYAVAWSFGGPGLAASAMVTLAWAIIWWPA